MGVQGAPFSTKLEQANIENKPYLFEYTFTFTGSETGLTLRFKLEATNVEGSTMSSQYLSILLARSPNKPANPL